MLVDFSIKKANIERGTSKNKVISDNIIATENKAEIIPKSFKSTGLMFR